MENLPKVLRDHRGSRDLSSDASDGDGVYQKPLDATDDARQSSLVGYGNTPQSTSANVFPSSTMETATGGGPLSAAPRAQDLLSDEVRHKHQDPPSPKITGSAVTESESASLLDPASQGTLILNNYSANNDNEGRTRQRGNHEVVTRGQQSVVLEQGPIACWHPLKEKLKENKKKVCVVGFALSAGMLLLVAIVAVFSIYATQTTKKIILPGSVVELWSGERFWHDYLSVTEEKPDDSEKVEAQIYIEYDCGSKLSENETHRSFPKISYTEPSPIIELTHVYLLAGSHVTMNVTVYPDSDFEYPAKVCQFSQLKDYDSLLEADSISALEKAERNGQCHEITKPSQNATTTTTTSIEFSIHYHGYYHYALAIFVDPEKRNTKNITLAYSYTLHLIYYDERSLTPLKCSVVDEDCTKSDLTLKPISDFTFCVLAYTPIPPSEDLIPYTFVVTLSNPYGIVIVAVTATFAFVISVLAGCCLSKCGIICRMCRRS